MFSFANRRIASNIVTARVATPAFASLRLMSSGPPPALWGEDLPPDSVDYKDRSSRSTRFKENLNGGFISTAFKIPGVRSVVNTTLINKICSLGEFRPYPLTCKSDYTSYDALTDYSYYGRHLPAASDEYMESLPELGSLKKIFSRENGIQTMCPRSTNLFPTFAQHLIDSFVQTKVKEINNSNGVEFEWNKTTTSHDIGLSPLYGNSPEQARQLRLCNNQEGEKGRLKSQIISGEEWAPFLFDQEGKVKDEFNKLDYPQGLDHILEMVPGDSKSKKSKVFAFGGARTNLTPNISAWNTLLLREHNRIAGEIEKSEPTWDDDRVFETTRNVLLVIYLKQVVEEYIAHITGYGIDPFVEPKKSIWHAPWYKRNWISAEFSVLYRWHALVPNSTKWGGNNCSTLEALFNNTVLLDADGMNGSLRDTFVNISKHRAASLQLFNTEKWLVDRDLRAVQMSRSCRLKSYADYSEYLGAERPKSFEDISKDIKVQNALKESYGSPDRVEFFVGLMAADHPPEGLFSGLMTKFVAMDAFNQALTHPLLSENVWQAGEGTFGKYGMSLLKEKNFKIKDLIQRNTNNGEKLTEFVGMSVPGYKVKSSFF